MKKTVEADTSKASNVSAGIKGNFKTRCRFSSKDIAKSIIKSFIRDSIKGSITVEAALIVPLVLLSIAAVIYTGLLLYQRSLTQSAAAAAADAGASAWTAGTFSIGTSRPDTGKSELYRRIFDSGSERRLREIEEYAAALSTANEIIAPADTAVEAVVKDYAVCRKLEVSISKSYEMPLGKVVRMFGGSDRIVINVKSAAVISEPVELIRNTDFIIDIEKQLENRFPELRDTGGRIREKMNELKSRLEDFAG